LKLDGNLVSDQTVCTVKLTAQNLFAQMDSAEPVSNLVAVLDQQQEQLRRYVRLVVAFVHHQQPVITRLQAKANVRAQEYQLVGRHGDTSLVARGLSNLKV
jgi:hypothetical protein